MYDEAEVDVSCCHGCAAKIRFLSNGLFCLIGSPLIKGTESGPAVAGLLTIPIFQFLRRPYLYRVH